MIRILTILTMSSLLFSFDMKKEFKPNSRCRSLPHGNYKLCRYILKDLGGEKLIDIDISGVGDAAGRFSLKVNKVDESKRSINHMLYLI